MHAIEAHPVLPYSFAHIHTIEIFALALAPAPIVHPQGRSGFRPPLFLSSHLGVLDLF